MVRKITIGRIQLTLGIIFVILVIAISLYSYNFILESYNSLTRTSMEKIIEERENFDSNETLSIYNLQSGNFIAGLTGDYIIFGAIIFAGGIIVIVFSINMILQGLINIKSSEGLQ